MPRDGYKTLMTIRTELWKNSDSQNRVKEEKLRRTIKRNAGLSRKTVSKYLRELKEFGIIEEVGEGLYEVEEPESEYGIESKKTRISVEIDKSIKKMIESLGLDRGVLMTEAALEAAEMKKEYLVKSGFKVDDLEAEIIMELLKNDLYRESFKDLKEKKRKNIQRREIYREIYDLEKMENKKGHFSHLEELRKKTFELAEQLGKVDRPDDVSL